jgi:hypothetical protein
MQWWNSLTWPRSFRDQVVAISCRVSALALASGTSRDRALGISTTLIERNLGNFKGWMKFPSIG